MHLRPCRWPSDPLIRLLSALFGSIGVGILLKSNSYPCQSVTTATCDWGQPGKPENRVLSVKACHLSASGGANRGHLSLAKVLKVTFASVGPLCVSVIRVSLQLDLPRRPSPPPGVSLSHIHNVSLRLDLPGLRRDLLGRATLCSSMA